MVDAAMRCLVATGYLNFRMRALVVSFFVHQLWQPWQACSVFLARQFLDFEPGIHFPQLQMQAGSADYIPHNRAIVLKDEKNESEELKEEAKQLQKSLQDQQTITRTQGMV